MMNDDIEVLKQLVKDNLRRVPASIAAGSVNLVREYKKAVGVAQKSLKSHDALKVRIALSGLTRFGA